MADASQALALSVPNPPPEAALKVVWMYQHPSNRPLYRHYSAEHTAILEKGWQAYHGYEGPNYVEIQIPDDNGGFMAAVVFSPTTGIRRDVKRYLEEEP